MTLTTLEAIEWSSIIDSAGGLRDDRTDDILASQIVNQIHATADIEANRRTHIVESILALNPTGAAALARVVDEIIKESL